MTFSDEVIELLIQNPEGISSDRIFELSERRGVKKDDTYKTLKLLNRFRVASCETIMIGARKGYVWRIRIHNPCPVGSRNIALSTGAPHTVRHRTAKRPRMRVTSRSSVTDL